jgi:DNA excision repair protein ERCC-2
MAVKIHLAKKTVSLGVGDLVAEPLGQAGRVAGIRTWTRLALGREAHTQHQQAQSELHTGYAREIFVRHTTTVDDFTVKIQGRIDGVYQPSNGGPWIVEEIKSVIVSPLEFAALAAESYPHYLEQLRLYCFFTQQQAPDVVGRLVYLNVADGTRRDIETTGPFDDCGRLIADRIRALITTARDREWQQAQRRMRGGELRFPHERPRQHQDAMIAAVDNALAKGRHLLVSAPSGIGKTAGALYPTVRYALANDMRVFFVTAKNTQAAIAIETLRKLNVPTAVAFRARESMCINDTYACREEFCQHLRDFALKLEQTRVADRLLEQRLILPEAMMEAGRGARLCPFELALLEAERTDVIVCDYNYVFDPQVYFRRFFQDADYSDAILVIDEAHNLVQRAMDYYSPSLHRRQVRDLMKNLKHLDKSLARNLKAFLGELDDFFGRQAVRQPDEYSQVDDPPRRDETKFLIEPPRQFFESLKPEFTRLSLRYVLDKVAGGRAIPDDPVEEFFGDFGQFCGVLAMDGEEFSHVFDAGEETVEIVCKDPSRQLAKRIEGFHSVIAMSATLEPVEFYRQMLGFDPERTDDIRLPSPFPKENRKILVVPRVSTTFRYRSANVGKIAEIIATTASARAGNYMALFPSYDFMKATAQHLDLPVIVQEPRMTEVQRQEVLDALKTNRPPKLVLAVQGGLFAEGVDFVGEMLSGVIVVSPALPQVSFERELMRQYYESRYSKGFEFAYLYLGMNRVIQSVGRLIRTETDRGVAVLVCQRFAQPQYSTLFPPDWSNDRPNDLLSKDLESELRRFWSER